MIKLSEKIHEKAKLDLDTPYWGKIAGEVAQLETQNATLLEACKYALHETVRPNNDPLIRALKDAIRKGKGD